MLVLPSNAPAGAGGYLYNARFVQAAPGKLLELIDHSYQLVAAQLTRAQRNELMT